MHSSGPRARPFIFTLLLCALLGFSLVGCARATEPEPAPPAQPVAPAPEQPIPDPDTPEPNTPEPNTPEPDSPTPDDPQVRIWQPQPGTSWQWQLSGELDTSFEVDMYDIDLFDTPTATIKELQEAGSAVICYFSAGSFEAWRPDADDFPQSVKGKKMDGWDELWLDISKLDELRPIMLNRLELAAEKGCDGVEPDNVDAYINDTGVNLSYDDQLTYNIFLATEAHKLGLSIGLKNDLDQVEELEPYFDWALNEQCFQYDECELLLPFVKANKAVFGVEYSEDPAEFCPVMNALNFDWLYKDLNLGAKRQSCR